MLNLRNETSQLPTSSRTHELETHLIREDEVVRLAIEANARTDRSRRIDVDKARESRVGNLPRSVDASEVPSQALRRPREATKDRETVDRPPAVPREPLSLQTSPSLTTHPANNPTRTTMRSIKLPPFSQPRPLQFAHCLSSIRSISGSGSWR